MVDFCPKCKKPRAWKAQRDRAGHPMFRRLKYGDLPGYCRHVLPLRINISYPPEGVL